MEIFVVVEEHYGDRRNFVVRESYPTKEEADSRKEELNSPHKDVRVRRSELMGVD